MIVKNSISLNSDVCTRVLIYITALTLYINDMHWGIRKTIHTKYLFAIYSLMFYITYFLVHLINYLHYFVYHFSHHGDFHSYIRTKIFLNSKCDRCMKSLKELVYHLMMSHNMSWCNYNKRTNDFNRLYGPLHSLS